MEVIDRDVSRNAEFSLFLEPISPNSDQVFYVYPSKAIGKTPVIIRYKLVIGKAIFDILQSEKLL